MNFNLANLPEEGKKFSFSPEKGELSPFLIDLIGSGRYTVDFEILPLGNAFKIEGQIFSEYQEQCSQCGNDTSVLIKDRINEILMVQEAMPRDGKSSQGATVGEGDSLGPTVTFIESLDFELGEFIHEVIAAAMENFPRCSDQKSCGERKALLLLEKDKAASAGHPAFQALKDFSVKPH